MKQKIFIFLLISVSMTLISSEKNPYKDDKKIHHSLYREKDSLERLSIEYTGIPQPKEEYY